MFLKLPFVALLVPFLVYTPSAQADQDASNGAALVKVPTEKIPQFTVDDAGMGSWEAGSKDALKQALTRQLDKCKTQNAKDVRLFGDRLVTRDEWCIKPAKWFLDHYTPNTSLQELYDLATREFEWYQSTGKTGQGDMLFTGYFYPEIKAQKKKGSVYKYPIYQKPSDASLATLPRERIASGALAGKKLEIAYASDPLDPYFLEIQGSGALLITDDSGVVTERMILNFAATNGQKYVSLGRLMREAGVDESYISMQGIHRYFKEHPEKWSEFSNQNPSFVFFQVAKEGPYGSAAVILTPKHSIAVDQTLFPLGAIAVVQTDRPAIIEGENTTAWKPFAQIMIAQDTGGAIQGAGHVDLYYGSGDYARVAAGQTQHPGSLYFMVTK